MSTVIVFDAAGGRRGGMGARRVGLEVLVMEYKLGLPGFGRYEKNAGVHFRRSPYRLKWILN